MFELGQALTCDNKPVPFVDFIVLVAVEEASDTLGGESQGGCFNLVRSV